MDDSILEATFYLINAYMIITSEDLHIVTIIKRMSALLFVLGLMGYAIERCRLRLHQRRRMYKHTQRQYLTMLIRYGYIPLLKKHINKDNINSKCVGPEGVYTPLAYAIYAGTDRTDTIQFLIDQGADVNFNSTFMYLLPWVQTLPILIGTETYCNNALKLLIKNGLTYKSLHVTNRCLTGPYVEYAEKISMYFRLLPFLVVLQTRRKDMPLGLVPVIASFLYEK